MGLPLVIPSASFCSCGNLDQKRPPSTFTITHRQILCLTQNDEFPPPLTQASLNFPVGSELWRE